MRERVGRGQAITVHEAIDAGVDPILLRGLGVPVITDSPAGQNRTPSPQQTPNRTATFEESSPPPIENQARPPGSDTPTLTEVETFLEDNGFRPLEPTRTDWYRPGDGTAISDVHQRQFVRGENGVVPVEALIQSLPGGMPLELAEQVDRPDNQNYSFEQSESSHTHSTESDRLETNNHLPKDPPLQNTSISNEQERSDKSGFYEEAEGRLENLEATPGSRTVLIQERAEAAQDSLQQAVANRLRRFGVKVLTRQDKTENTSGVSRYRRDGGIEVSVPERKLLSIIQAFEGRGDAPLRIAEALESIFQEEEFHAAEKISLRERWEINPDGKDFLQYVSDWVDQEIADFIDALDDNFLTTTSPAIGKRHQMILAKAIASSSRIYYGGDSVVSSNGIIPLLTDLHLLDNDGRWELLAEFFRQVVQIRRSGKITESTMNLPERIELYFDFSPEDFNQWIADVKAAEELFRELPADFPLNRQIIATEKILDIIELPVDQGGTDSPRGNRGARTDSNSPFPGDESNLTPSYDETDSPLSREKFDSLWSRDVILTTSETEVNHEGRESIQQHLNSLGNDASTDPANLLMLDRLRKIISGELDPTSYDLYFYTHELREITLLESLGGYTDDPVELQRRYIQAHDKALRDYGLDPLDSDEILYHPDAVELF